MMASAVKKEPKDPKNQRIQVFARCRPLNAFERKQCSPNVVEVVNEKKEIIVKDKNISKEFFFDKVFGTDSTQVTVYKSVVAPLIKEVLMGYNCTVFAYGQTGTGKTYTMEGERSSNQGTWEDDPGAGIIPRSLHQLFEELNREENVEFSVRVSFLELYNEELFDLLSSNELSRLRLFEDATRKGSVVIQGLEEIMVNSKDEVYAILEKGTARRQTAATMLNATSSRSHTVFSVTIHIKENTIDGEELLKTGKLNLVDLAGSENIGRSGAVDKRAREAGNINQSLLTLGRVITSLIEKAPHIPYRESKLTRLLQDSLGGHTKTSIIATISPALCNFDETLSTLDYANKAKNISIKPEINQKMTKRALIREYTSEIERLRKDLAAARAKDGFYVDHDNYTSMQNEILYKSDVIKELSNKIEATSEEFKKVEDMFNETNFHLSERTKELKLANKKIEDTTSKLTDTTNVLQYTKKVLSETTLERDEKQYLITKQCDTEKKLSKQAKTLLKVASQTSEHVSGLHAKIERKQAVEDYNSESFQELKESYKNKIADLDSKVSDMQQNFSLSLRSIEKDLETFMGCIASNQAQHLDSMNELCSMHTRQLSDLSSELNLQADGNIASSGNLLDSITSKQAKSLLNHHKFLTENVPTLYSHLHAANSDMTAMLTSMHKQFQEKVQLQEKNLNSRIVEKRKLINDLQSGLNGFFQSHENLLEKVDSQTKNVISRNNSETTVIEDILKQLQSYVDEKKHMETDLSKVASTQLELRENVSLGKAVEQEHLAMLSSVEKDFDADQKFVADLAKSVDLDELLSKNNKICEQQDAVKSQLVGFFGNNEQLETEGLKIIQDEFESHATIVKNTTLRNQKNVDEIVKACDKMTENHTTAVKEHNSSLCSYITRTADFSEETVEKFKVTADELKNEILRCGTDLETFISENLVEDIPTGLTPLRQTYNFPRLLAATSPHERILQRFRSRLEKDTANALILPLDSDSESDSSLGKNKENAQQKKGSKLPKRLPKSKEVAPPPVPRQPLTSTNLEG